MRAFVTGGAGFIGRSLIRQLRERGDEVRALSRSPASADALRRLGAEPVAGDLANVDGLAEAMAGCDAALQLAGEYRIGIAAPDRPKMYAANVAGAVSRQSAG